MRDGRTRTEEKEASKETGKTFVVKLERGQTCTIRLEVV